MAEKIKVTVWNEGRHEKSDADAKAMYPNGIHGAIKEFLDKNAFSLSVGGRGDRKLRRRGYSARQ